LRLAAVTVARLLTNLTIKSSGIGLYIALHLVRRGAKVYLAARSEEKAEHAIGRMEQEGMGEHPGELVWLPIDFTDPRRAKAAAEWFVKRESRLDILGTSGKMPSVWVVG
jgi:NAD(P)-dependent dehydrogenase (short-subunit alcohol dehydrogenase family)